MYLRFVRPNLVGGMRVRQGIFCAAYELRYACTLDNYSRESLNELLMWFCRNLSAPPRFNRTRSKGFYRKQVTSGLCWFKPSASAHLAKAYELATLLSQHGYHIDVLKNPRPGYVVYEDEHQLVAEPFSNNMGRVSQYTRG